MDLDNNNHSVFLLRYRLILAVNQRKNIINDSISMRLKGIFENIAPNYNITVEEWDYGADHLSITLKGNPNTELSKFINAYKSASSRLIKKEFPEVCIHLWEGRFWSRSFCLLTIGEATVDITCEYIESQGK